MVWKEKGRCSVAAAAADCLLSPIHTPTNANNAMKRPVVVKANKKKKKSSSRYIDKRTNQEDELFDFSMLDLGRSNAATVSLAGGKSMPSGNSGDGLSSSAAAAAAADNREEKKDDVWYFWNGVERTSGDEEEGGDEGVYWAPLSKDVLTMIDIFILNSTDPEAAREAGLRSGLYLGNFLNGM